MIKDAKEAMEATLQDPKKYLLFQQDRFFMKLFKVAIELTNDTKIEGEKVLLTITHQEYKEEVRQVRVYRRHLAIQGKMQEASNEQKAASVAFTWGQWYPIEPHYSFFLRKFRERILFILCTKIALWKMLKRCIPTYRLFLLSRTNL